MPSTDVSDESSGRSGMLHLFTIPSLALVLEANSSYGNDIKLSDSPDSFQSVLTKDLFLLLDPKSCLSVNNGAHDLGIAAKTLHAMAASATFWGFKHNRLGLAMKL
eukprot:CAMPEP_0171411174 /NCGR_PEP_ID=MMETSP0880-20121228/29430_1 /TAXON_ID=67004 /ORGANISM="Thalassiosira weissflogii, Strain CCMP1336" /LENGTH=105 /DNA_ID=CAMNT_0011928199 /DNA_START=13 /DNA_END=330 /DNA_ORIENTATION=+